VQVTQGGASREAYTRAGGFSVDADGQLRLDRHAVLGEGGPVTLPPFSKLEISADGVISVRNGDAATLQQVDRLKLVNPEFSQLRKDEAGLLVARNGEPLPADANVRVAGGRLEGSNVVAVEEMVATMNLSRDFEIQMRLFKSADTMAEAGNRLIRD
jgi:flagellar basal-body rod protein FlgF